MFKSVPGRAGFVGGGKCILATLQIIYLGYGFTVLGDGVTLRPDEEIPKRRILFDAPDDDSGDWHKYYTQRLIGGSYSEGDLYLSKRKLTLYDVRDGFR